MSEQFPQTLEIDQAAAGFESWWAEEGHGRYQHRFVQSSCGVGQDSISVKHVARDSWHNARHSMIKRVRRYAELVLFAPFATCKTEELFENETLEQAEHRFASTYGKLIQTESGVIEQRGELAAIVFYERLEAELDGLLFLSGETNRTVIIYDKTLVPRRS